MLKRIKIYYLFTLLCVSTISCKKDFLEVKPDQQLLVPSSLSDLAAILNHTDMNFSTGMHIIATDDYQIFAESTLATFGSTTARNAYLWKKDLYENSTFMPDWDKAYQQVFYANVVLDALEKIERGMDNASSYDNIKGYALFFRAVAFYQLAVSFTSTYTKDTNTDQLGIPLKLSADVNEKLVRSSLQETYNTIISDLKAAKALIQKAIETQPVNPSKLAVDAILARVFLSIGDYENALIHAGECIASKGVLMDYNNFSRTSNRPISFNEASNTEVIYWQWMHSYPFASGSATSVSTDIVNSYHASDLRKYIFLRDRGNGVFTFKGNYTGDSYVFTGPATDEMYLIRAECSARLGNIDLAMKDLAFLLKHRWDNTKPLPVISATDRDQALAMILENRRKELVTRGSRWSDLRRLNLDSRYAVELKRVLSGIVYTLPPNDPRYVFPIPTSEVKRHGFQQNER